MLKSQTTVKPQLSRYLGGALLAIAVAMPVAGSGCSAGSGGATPKRGTGGSAAGGSVNVPGSLDLGGSGGAGITLGGTGNGSPVGPCESDGWRCKIADCTGQTPTTVRATVYDPAGVNPLYNVAEQLTDDKNAPFPGGCASNPMTAQEKALEFLLFDLSSCVMTTDEPPRPPVVVK